MKRQSTKNYRRVKEETVGLIKGKNDEASGHAYARDEPGPENSETILDDTDRQGPDNLNSKTRPEE